jgi:L-lactate dehydrogenase
LAFISKSNLFSNQNVSSEIALVDVMADKLQGEMLDLQHGSAFMKNAKVQAGTGNSESSRVQAKIVSNCQQFQTTPLRLDPDCAW